VRRRSLRGDRPGSGKDREAPRSSRDLRGIVCVCLERRDSDVQPVGERQAGEQIVEFGLAVGAVQPDRVACEGPSPEPHEMPARRELGGGGRLGAVALLDLRLWRAGGNFELELDEELHIVSPSAIAPRPRRPGPRRAVLHAATLTAVAMTASRMTLATMSGWD